MGRLVVETVFDTFKTIDYTFIQVEPITGGYKSVKEYSANGVIKFRDGKVNTGKQESLEIQTTLHIRPTEPFIDAVGGIELVGHFVRVDGVEYRIKAVTTGRNFDNGQVEHYRASLEKANLWQSDLPLN